MQSDVVSLTHTHTHTKEKGEMSAPRQALLHQLSGYTRAPRAHGNIRISNFGVKAQDKQIQQDPCMWPTMKNYSARATPHLGHQRFASRRLHGGNKYRS